MTEPKLISEVWCFGEGIVLGLRIDGLIADKWQVYGEAKAPTNKETPIHINIGKKGHCLITE